ncbi:GvpL/GvpF family gas vesicle protein [Allorhizocola rhizosphaerae]|uniref:GvpL/GvpF family gas vesicle protein n=1 Tax=Allorhizocola rhizosphaerae TaxID=1872709 RepID=UPI0013C2B1A9|nr:GvpL/GvpF family gas vesicle protein [Allorhizocola rhizosphaerae]
MPAIWYVYAIVEASAVPGLELPSGIDDVRPSPVVAAGGLAAIAAQVDPAGLAVARADHALAAHDRVIQEIFFQGVPVLPLRFGVVHASRAAVVTQLVTQRSWMRAELDRVRDAAQWSVRIASDAWLERQSPQESVETVAWQAARIYDGRIYLARQVRLPSRDPLLSI